MNPRTIIRTYFAITGLFNLAMSLIWGIDTLFKMGAGLDIQQVLLTNAAFTLGSMVFEVPTGVVADTVGRRVSLLLCLVTLFVTTLLYVAIAWRGWGFWAFMWVSVFLGLGYTFYTGAVDAWLVDALKASGYNEPLERVFSRGQMLFGAAMLVGTIGGGLLGQIRLDIPYVARAALVVPLFLLAWFRMPEVGFTPRALEFRRVPAELRRVFVEGLTYGLSNPVIRPVMLASLVSMSFMIFGYYSWQRYFLDLLGRDLVWVDGVISALVGLSLIAGNALVAPLSRVLRTRTGLLMLSAAAQAMLAVACGLLTNFYLVVRRHRARDARQAVVSQRAHSVGPASDDPLARLDVRERRRRARADGVGLDGADALDRHGVGVERADTTAGHPTLLAGPTP